MSTDKPKLRSEIESKTLTSIDMFNRMVMTLGNNPQIQALVDSAPDKLVRGRTFQQMALDGVIDAFEQIMSSVDEKDVPIDAYRMLIALRKGTGVTAAAASPVTEADARTWSVRLTVERGGREVVTGETSIGRIRRTFGELAQWLFRSQRFPHGAVLLTGTGVVPPDDFTLEEGDRIRIQISGIGTLENTVVRV